MKCGCITLRFKKGLDDDNIKSVIESIYRNNRESIDGMAYFQFDDVTAIQQIETCIEEMDAVRSDKPTTAKAEQMTLDDHAQGELE